MRLLLAFLLLIPLAAQESSQKPAEPAAEAQPAETKDEKAAASPFPAEDSWVSADIDVGYRWTQDVRGNNSTYRSVVNLGEGVRLMGLDLTLRDPKKRAFDRANLFVHNWGDPYNTLRADVFKNGWYRFLADYRNTAYFNNLASFANPLLAQGNLVSERAFDMRRKYTNTSLELFPGKVLVPYFSYTRDWSDGNGVTPFVIDQNEYAVPIGLNNRTDHYRGGVRLELKNYHATIEEGGTQYSEDANVDFTGRNYGNRTTPYFGNRLMLNRLTQLYGISGDSRYTRVMLTGSPSKWLNFFGQFLYSQPKTNVAYNDAASGLFQNVATLQVYSGVQDGISSLANQPHTSGNAGVELKPFSNIRFVYSFWTDRFHNATSALLTEQLLLGGTVSPAAQASYFNDRLSYNYNQHRFDLFIDVTPKLAVRGGYHYVWGDSQVRPSSLNQFTTAELGDLEQKIGLAGFTYRPSRKWSVSTDYEGATSRKFYFRTSLRNYQKLRARARYELTSNLLLSGNYSLLDNQNPATRINFDMRQQMIGASVQWMPKGGKRFMIIGDYTRSAFRTDLNYLDPGFFLQPTRSFYRDNSHVATALGEFSFPAIAGRTIKADFGGSLFVSAGSRPTNYYQPIGRLVIPIVKQVQWYGEWRWYGYNESYYLYEDFRTNHFLTGLRFSL